MIAVAGLLISSFTAYASTIRASSETRQLKVIMDHVASESTQLVTFTLTMNSTIEEFVQMPTTIGSRQYWLQLRNDSESAWLEGGFGSPMIGSTGMRADLPREVAAAGRYVAGHGAARLSCSINDGKPLLVLGNSEEGN